MNGFVREEPVEYEVYARRFGALVDYAQSHVITQTDSVIMDKIDTYCSAGAVDGARVEAVERQGPPPHGGHYPGYYPPYYYYPPVPWPGVLIGGRSARLLRAPCERVLDSQRQ